MDTTQKARLSAMVGKKTAKSCPDCGAVLIVRKNRENESFFLGCGDYPNCRHTENIDEAMYLDILGYKKMF